jgi:hypothetical protein
VLGIDLELVDIGDVAAKSQAKTAKRSGSRSGSSGRQQDTATGALAFAYGLKLQKGQER